MKPLKIFIAATSALLLAVQDTAVAPAGVTVAAARVEEVPLKPVKVIP